MERVFKLFVVFATLALSLALLLQCVHQSQFIRLYGDDFRYLGKALESGTWQAVLYSRERWQGDYTNLVLYGMLTPLGERAPALISNVFIATGLVGFSALMARVLTFFCLDAHRRLAAFALASLILVAFIYGAYTPITFYWLTGCVEYSLPVVVLSVCLALGAAAVKWARSGLRLSLAAIAFAAAAFIVAGFSEMYLVFQAVCLTSLGIYALVFARGQERRAYMVIIAAALAGTAASLALQMSSPGIHYRLSLPEYFGLKADRVLDLPSLIVGAAKHMPRYLTDHNAISVFKLLAAAGLAVTLTLTQPASQRPPAKPKLAAPWPFVVMLIIQLAFIPYLWSHGSDSRVVFGRFSYSYMLTIGLNMAMICFAIVMSWRPKRLREFLNTPRGQLIYSSTVLLIVGGLFALPEIRGIVDRAYLHSWVTSCLLAGILLWQLAFCFADPEDWRSKRIGWLTLFSAVLTVAILAIMLAVGLRMQGFVLDYIFTPVLFPFAFTGLLWGAAVGTLIRRQLSAVNAATALLRWASLLSLLVAAAIGWNIFTAQTRMTDELKEGARVWDATYQELLMLRDMHPTRLAYRELRFRRYHISRIWPVRTGIRHISRVEERFYRLN